MLGFSLGASSVQNPSQGFIVSEIITLSHTNSTATPASGQLYNSGQGESNFTSLGASISGGSIVPSLTGTWNGLTVPANITNIEVRSNIVAADISSAGAGKDIEFALHQGWVQAAGSWSSGPRNSVANGKINDVGAAVTTNAPAFDINVPGTLTTYSIADLTLNTDLGNPQLAAGTNYTEVSTMNGIAIAGRAYWSYQFSIDDAYPTKDYKFQIVATVDFPI